MAYKVARTLILPHHTILDFGSGKFAQQTQLLRQAGYNAVAYDKWAHDEGAEPGLHDKDALSRKYDVVMAGNVVNVQENRKDLAHLLNQIANAVHPANGMAIVAFTADPRYDAFKGMTNEQANTSVEVSLKRRFHQVDRHPMGKKNAPIWICKKPKGITGGDNE